jgi:NAD(P)-dependent dehydrogenase (short-subunit alcohol dehydrogenase family)
MDYGLTGKIALVTGTGSQRGFGKGIALTLAKEGCDIVATDVDLKGAELTAAEVRESGRKAKAYQANLSEKTQVDDMVKKALSDFGRIDILVNNAGISSKMQPFIESTEKDWDLDINVNFKGTLHCTRAVLPQMIERKKGSIINISSPAGIWGVSVSTTYSSAKAAVIVFSKSIAAGLKTSGINVNVVTPFGGTTNFAVASQTYPHMIEFFKKEEELGHLSTPSDIGFAVAFFASEIARGITGQVVGA